ncbi:MAG: TraB/GumN family protein [Erysipelotrichaceae bacterium]|nr:TraB/GumN family protein [Erysipelotrichaceae bacterium]
MCENIVKLNYQDKQIYLVKTAHVSKSSVEDVERCIDEVDPDSICIELDEQRYEKMKNPDQWRETDLVKVIKDRQVGFLLVNLILSSFQKRMAKSLGSQTGGEMAAGIRLAEERNKNLILADRSIKTTFSRIWNSLAGKEKFKMLTGIIGSIFDEEEISEEDLQKLKEADALEAALMDIAKEFPTIKKVLVDERDQYLTEKIRTAPGSKIVAIIGAAHSLGIEKYINDDIDLEALDRVEKKKGIASLLKYLIPLGIIVMIAYTIFTNRDAGFEQIRSWILWNGGLSALGVLLALGHPLSILTAFIMSPLTSLNPLLASGWFAGLVEASIRKPKVKDFEDLGDDISTLKGFWKNRVTRTLLVVVFANLFSSLGTFISGIDIVKKFIENL